VRERRFADPAQAQGGEGDTQLAGRQVGIELAVHGAQDVPRQPFLSAMASTRVERSLTMANSAATKKPLSSTRIRAKRIMPKSAKT
jgi:hypothetical protein